MPKMTIYVPDELEEAMSKVSFIDKTMSWSSLAQEAFSREVTRFNDRMKVAPKMRDAVDRLRRSKERTQSTAKAAGDVAGRRWATERAEYAELVRLRRYSNRQKTNPPAQPSTIGKVWPVYEAITGYDHINYPPNAYDPDECVDFWSTWADDATDDFVDAFVNGAVEVFNEIEQQL